MPENLASDYLPAQPKSGNGNGNGHSLSPSDREVEHIRGWPMRPIIIRRPDFYARSCEAYRRIFTDPEVSAHACRLYGLIREFSMVNVPGSDQSGGWEVSIRKLSKLTRSSKNNVSRWIQTLVKKQFLTVQKMALRGRKDGYKYYIRAIVPDEVLARIEGMPPVPTAGTGQSPQQGLVSPHSRDSNGPAPGTGTALLQGQERPCSGDTLNTKGEGRGEKGRGEAPRGASPPVFGQIPEKTFPSTLKLMLREAESMIRTIPAKYSAAVKVFLQAGNCQWLEQEATKLVKTKTGKATAAKYLEKAAKLKADPTNWTERQVLTMEGQQHLQAWKDYAAQIRQRLTIGGQL